MASESDAEKAMAKKKKKNDKYRKSSKVRIVYKKYAQKYIHTQAYDTRNAQSQITKWKRRADTEHLALPEREIPKVYTCKQRAHCIQVVVPQ